MKKHVQLLVVLLALLSGFALGAATRPHFGLIVAALQSQQARVLYHAIVPPIVVLLKLLLDAILRRIFTDWTPPRFPWRGKKGGFQ